jgi:hypothetical protein
LARNPAAHTVALPLTPAPIFSSHDPFPVPHTRRFFSASFQLSSSPCVPATSVRATAAPPPMAPVPSKLDMVSKSSIQFECVTYWVEEASYDVYPNRFSYDGDSSYDAYRDESSYTPIPSQEPFANGVDEFRTHLWGPMDPRRPPQHNPNARDTLRYHDNPGRYMPPKYIHISIQYGLDKGHTFGVSKRHKCCHLCGLEWALHFEGRRDISRWEGDCHLCGKSTHHVQVRLHNP